METKLETREQTAPPGPTDGEPAPPGGRGHRAFVRALRMLPKWMVRIAANQYIAGDKLSEALSLADKLWQDKRYHSTMDLLGEDAHTVEAFDAATQEMHELLASLRDRPHANLSLKLSAIGQTMSQEECLHRARDLVAHARDIDSFVRLDMEDHTTIDSTLSIYRALRRDFDNCGIVLQSRLFRTPKDVEELADLRPNVRLCIGIYEEPSSIALIEKDEMKRRMLDLLVTMWDNGQHVGLATHEEWVIREALRIADQRSKPAEEIEVQMLLGVPREALLRELVERGIRVRLYVPYGREWHAYSMRRLEYNPDLLKMTVLNVLGGLFRRR